MIFHEYQHFIIGNNLSNVPVWLNEGLAEFYSTFETLDNDQKVRLGKPIGHHIMALRNNRLLPLETLLAVDSKSPHYNENSKAGIFYAQSWALTHYLMLGNGGKRQAQFSRFIKQLNTGIPLEENFRQSFQTDYKQIEEELSSYIRKHAFPVVEFTPSKQLDVVREMQSAPASEAEVNYYLGDLLLRSGRFDEAEPHLKKAVELAANFAPGRISLGILRLQQRKVSEANELFRSAIAADSSNYLGHVYYADTLSHDERYAEAIKSYQQAILLKPGVAGPHAALGFAYLSLGRDKEALEELQQAMRLNPLDSSFYRSLSFAHLRVARGILAATAATIYLKRQGWLDSSAPFVALAAHFGYRYAQQADNANKILTEAAAKIDNSSWPHPILRYLQNAITEQQLMSLATDTDKQTEAHAYVGLDQSLRGKVEAARAHLQWVKEQGNKDFVEYPLALAELERLASKNSSVPQ